MGIMSIQSPCNYSLLNFRQRYMNKEQKDPTLAGILSFFVPGMGHVYAGHVWQGIAMFLVTGLGFVFFIVPGIIVWIFAIWDAVDVTKKDNQAKKK